MANNKGPAWFRVYGNNQNIFKNLDDTAVGRGLKYAFEYFSSGKAPDISDPIAKAVFEVLKSGIDEALQGYALSVAAGKAGADRRYGRM